MLNERGGPSQTVAALFYMIGMSEAKTLVRKGRYELVLVLPRYFITYSLPELTQKCNPHWTRLY